MMKFITPIRQDLSTQRTPLNKTAVQLMNQGEGTLPQQTVGSQDNRRNVEIKTTISQLQLLTAFIMRVFLLKPHF